MKLCNEEIKMIICKFSVMMILIMKMEDYYGNKECRCY